MRLGAIFDPIIILHGAVGPTCGARFQTGALVGLL